MLMHFADLLRQAINATHDRIEQLPFAQAMVQGWVSRTDYGQALAQLGLMHAALESELARCPHLSGLYHPDMARGAAVERDLAVLGLPACHIPLAPTARCIAQIHQWAEQPAALVGCLYVFEGSRMGSMVLCRPLARAFGVPLEAGRGLDYHLEGLAERPRAWQRFRATLTSLSLTEPEQLAALHAARETMIALFDLYQEAGADLVAPATSSAATVAV